MRFSFSVALSLAGLVAPAVALACEGHKAESADSCGGSAAACGHGQMAFNTWKTLTPAELVKLQQNKNEKLALLDASTPQARSKHGVIPGATMLSSSAAYDIRKELPAVRTGKLVFYCSEANCTESRAAAERALAAGYTEVFVLADGVAGWKQAGQPTATPRS